MGKSRFRWALAAGLTLLLTTGRAPAQVAGTGLGVDPFSLYFGYYLPHQAYIAAQPRPMDTINANVAERQQNAVTDRAGLYDPISPFAQGDDLDPLRPYGPNSGKERVVRPRAFATSTTNAGGGGPAQYYNRTARYYPQLRIGQGPNRNLAVQKARGGMGLPSTPTMPSGPGLR
jgi:hypothetical protein